MGWRVDCFVLYLYGRSQQDRIEKKHCTLSVHTISPHVRCKFITYQYCKDIGLQRTVYSEEKKWGKNQKWKSTELRRKAEAKTCWSSFIVFSQYSNCVTAVYVQSTRNGVCVLEYFIDILCTQMKIGGREKKSKNIRFDMYLCLATYHVVVVTGFFFV